MSKMIWARARRASAIALALTVVLPACGGGGGGGGNAPTNVPPAPVRSLIGTFNFTVLGVPEANSLGLTRDFALQQLTINQAGSLEIIVDWTFASNDIDIVLFSGTCTPTQLINTGCPVITNTVSVTQKPERLTTNVNPGSFTIGVTNFGNGNESGVGQVFLTR